MKKFAFLMLFLSLGLVSVGCDKSADKAAKDKAAAAKKLEDAKAADAKAGVDVNAAEKKEAIDENK